MAVSSYAQEKRTYPNVTSKSFKWEDGFENLVDVKYNHQMKDTIAESDLHVLAINVLLKTKFKCSNMMSFVPIELSILQKHAGGEINALMTYKAKKEDGTDNIEKVLYKIVENYEVVELSSM